MIAASQQCTVGIEGQSGDLAWMKPDLAIVVASTTRPNWWLSWNR